MAGVDESIVREYFEMHGFLVRQLRKYQIQARAKRDDEQIDLIVYNPTFIPSDRKPSLMLFATDLPLIQRAIVVVKGWHSQRFSAATLRSSSEIFKFLEKDVLKQAEGLFDLKDKRVEGMGAFSKILVIPGLPTHEPHKSQSIAILEDAGIDAILSFRSMLQEIVSHVEVNHNYQKSDMLQILRLLKNYDMIKSPQLELFDKKNK